MDFIMEYGVETFLNFDYHTQVFMCFALFMAGLVAVSGSFLLAYYSGGAGKLLWRLVGLIVLGAFSFVSTQGFVVGFHNYRVAKAERIKEAKVRQEIDRQRYELLQVKQAEMRAAAAIREAKEEAESQLASNMVISAFDFVNGKGVFLQPDTAQVTAPVPESVEIEVEEAKDDFAEGGNTMAKQQLTRSLKSLERDMREQLRDINRQVREADEAYKLGQTSTYQQLLSKARLEQEKNKLIIAFSDEKLAIIKDADYLSDEERQATLESNQKRRDAAAVELAQYAEVEQVLINRRDEYEVL